MFPGLAWLFILRCPTVWTIGDVGPFVEPRVPISPVHQ